MLTKDIINAITQLTQEYWTKEVQKNYFSNLASGKEIGHRIADLVDDKTAAILTAEYLVKHEHDKKYRRKIRSMGDVWVSGGEGEGGIYHPVNIKTGIVGREGQPNLVSIKKLMDGLLARRIDSYYLLMVKFALPDEANSPQAEKISCQTYMVDMLDYLDCVTFDAGPGQAMLMAKKFFSKQSGNVSVSESPMQEKINNLLNLFKDGHRRLEKNRKASLNLYQKRVQEYLQYGQHCVTVQAQEALNLR